MLTLSWEPNPSLELREQNGDDDNNNILALESFMAFSALRHIISRLSSLVLAVPKEMALVYHLARNAIINEGKSGCKKPALM